MPVFLNTTGRAYLGIACCARCARKFPLGELYSDPNAPGLMVCRDDLDQYDPWRLAARTPENITLPFVRPDEQLIPVDTVLASILLESGGYLLKEDGGYILLEG